MTRRSRRQSVEFFLTLILLVLLPACREPMAQQEPPPAQGAVVSEAQWWNDEVFYEVFVRSFQDSDGDGNGDLQGLISKLDYLNDGDPATDSDLGVSGIWLMPVMDSPSYHGYDAQDYRQIEEDYGRNEDFQRLVDEAHKRDMKIIVDLMLNHTSNEHPWFVEAAASPDSPKRDWYVWRADDPGDTSSWGSPAWHKLGNTYYHGLFWEGMPDLNFRNPEVTAEMVDVARFWLQEMGVDGFRLDAVRHLIEKDGRFDGTQETHDWLVAWDDQIDALEPEALTIGEVWDETQTVAPYVHNDEVDIAFEFSLAEGILQSVREEHPAAFGQHLAQVLAAYPPGQFAPFLTNHDQNRVMSQLGGDVDGAKLAATTLLTLPGVPFIYYGEEIGMEGQKPDELIRTPMQWSGQAGAGFSSGQPWQGLQRDYKEVNVAAQEQDPASLLNHYRALIHLRSAYPVLRRGSLHSLASSCDAVYAYLRYLPGESPLLVVLNFSKKEQTGCTFSLDSSELEAGSYQVTDLLHGQGTAELSIASQGSIADYIPLERIEPRQQMLLRIGE